MKDQHYLTTAEDIKVPGIIYGTAWKKDNTEALVVKAVLAGFRGIDTACQPKHYNEPHIGRALRKLRTHGITRESLFIQTKFTPLEGQDKSTVPYDKDASLATQVQQSFDVSKRNLQTEYIDALLLHTPLFPYANMRTVWKSMESIQKTGKVRQLGISNLYDLEVLKQLYEDATVKPMIIQNRFYQDSAFDKELRLWCLEHGIVYQSFWTLTANPHILDDKIILDLAKKYAKTTAQIFFRYLNLSGISVLTGTTSGLHMKEDLDLLSIDLSSQELESISTLLV